MKSHYLLTLLIFMIQIGAFSASQQKITFSEMPQVMPGTRALVMEGDISVQMMDGAHRFIDAKIDESLTVRSGYWNRDLSSPGTYERSVEPNRSRFMSSLGIAEKHIIPASRRVAFEDRNPGVYMQKISVDDDPEIIAETEKYRIYQVRWPVLDKVYGEGLLIQPKTNPVGNIIALPDAGQTPEQLAGMAPGIPAESQFARHFAENGFRVLIPVLICRKYINEGNALQMTYRERLYRQAFHMGKHLIGYEVQKVISAVDWFENAGPKELKTGVAGYCEGGLIALHSAAVDKRIDAALVSGYFNSRQKVSDEPLYRNVWRLLSEFGDAEIVSLIAPRPVVIEYSSVPEIIEKVSGKANNSDIGYKGRLQTPAFDEVRNEFDRIEKLTGKNLQKIYLVSGAGNRPASFGSNEAIEKLCLLMNAPKPAKLSAILPGDKRKSFNPEERQWQQFAEIEDHVQMLVRTSDQTRNKFYLHKVIPGIEKRSWSTRPYHPYLPSDSFIEKSKEYRKYFSENILGKFEEPMLPPDTRTRKIYDRERWTGYEVVMDVYPGLFAWGYFLIPKDIRPGERRPVVVVQHGRSGLPVNMVEGNSTAYNDVAARLADQGFIVYAPHNLYRGEDRYRFLSKKANSLGKTLFSFIISQHDQMLRWLGNLSFIDKERIAFYGLSYGGETAMRVPTVLEGYCLSICSGDFGDWTRKVADTYSPGTFMNTIEWEMPYFNMGSTFSYAEMAYLMIPRPFMVERGHDDLVQPDEWVAYEYGKVKYVYDQFNLGDKTEIEFYNGGHSMKCEGTFDFLHKHLNWP